MHTRKSRCISFLFSCIAVHHSEKCSPISSPSHHLTISPSHSLSYHTEIPTASSGVMTRDRGFQTVSGITYSGSKGFNLTSISSRRLYEILPCLPVHVDGNFLQHTSQCTVFPLFSSLSGFHSSSDFLSHPPAPLLPPCPPAARLVLSVCLPVGLSVCLNVCMGLSF